MDLKRRLFALRIKWETVRTEFGLRALLDALFAGGVYAAIIAAPIVALLVELLLMNMHRLYAFAVVFILVASGFVFLCNRLAYTALKLKKPAHESDAKGMLMFHMYVWLGIVFVLGLLFLLVFIPAMTA